MAANEPAGGASSAGTTTIQSHGLPSPNAVNISERVLQVYHHAKAYEAKFVAMASEINILRQANERQNHDLNTIQLALGLSEEHRRPSADPSQVGEQGPTRVIERIIHMKKELDMWSENVTKENERCRAEVNRHTNENAQLRAQCLEVEESLSEAERELFTLREQVQTPIDQDGKQTRRIQELETKVADKVSLLFRVRSDLEDAMEATEKSKKEAAESQTGLDSMRDQLRICEDKIDTLTEELSRMKELLRSETNANTTLQIKLQTAQVSIEQLQQDKTNAENMRKSSVMQLSQTLEKLELLKEQVSDRTDLEQKLQESNATQKDLRARVKELTERPDMVKLRNQFAHCTQENQDLHRLNSELRDKYDGLARQLNRLKEPDHATPPSQLPSRPVPPLSKTPSAARSNTTTPQKVTPQKRPLTLAAPEKGAVQSPKARRLPPPPAKRFQLS